MSYILDALRKADAQRVRDPARGIHAQPMPGADSERPATAMRTGLWVSIAVGTTALAAAAWYLHEDKPAHVAQQPSATGTTAAAKPSAVNTPPVAKVEVAALPPAPPPAPVAPVAPVVMPTETAAARSPADFQSHAPTAVKPARPVPTQSLALQSPAATGPGSMRAEGDPRNTSLPTMRGGPQPAPGMEPAPGAPAQATVTAPANPASQQAPAALARPAAPVVAAPAIAPAPIAPPPIAPAPSVPAPLVTGLPPDAPKLSISGGVYSSSAKQRMLIVNGQVFSEGADLGSGVVLEEIKPKSAVLKFRGTRYTVTY